jgi:hypothetical protein
MQYENLGFYRCQICNYLYNKYDKNKEDKMTQILVVIKGTNVEEVSTVEELILAQNQLKIIDQGYVDLRLPTPEWVLDKMGETGHEINMRVKNELARRLKGAKARRSALRTADEKRKSLDVEIAELENQLK